MNIYSHSTTYYSIDTQRHVIEIIQKGTKISLETDQYKHSIIENSADLVSYHEKDIYPFLRKVSKYLYRIFHGIQRLEGVDLPELKNLFNSNDITNLLKKLEEIKNNKTDIEKSEGLINELLNTGDSYTSSALFPPIVAPPSASVNSISVSKSVNTQPLIPTLQFIKNLIEFIKKILREDLLITQLKLK